MRHKSEHASKRITKPPGHGELSDQQMQVLVLMAQGKTSIGIAQLRDVSTSRIKRMKAAIKYALGLSRTATPDDVVAEARRRRIIH